MLSVEQIKRIPELKKTMTNAQISVETGMSEDQIQYWSRRLRSKGYDVPKGKAGRPSKIVL